MSLHSLTSVSLAMHHFEKSNVCCDVANANLMTYVGSRPIHNTQKMCWNDLTHVVCWISIQLNTNKNKGYTSCVRYNTECVGIILTHLLCWILTQLNTNMNKCNTTCVGLNTECVEIIWHINCVGFLHISTQIWINVTQYVLEITQNVLEWFDTYFVLDFNTSLFAVQ